MNKKTDLSCYDNSFYNPGNYFKRLLWHYTNMLIFNNSLLPFSKLKVYILKLFGAKIGPGVVIKHNVNIKYPWKLLIDDFSWIGENVWIDNLDLITIGKNVCISQGAMLLCGNHNYKKTSFELITNQIVIEDGSWVGAKSIVCPGVKLENHCVLTVGSVANSNLESYGVYMGNPAKKIRERIIE